LCDVTVTAAVGQSRGRGLLKFSSGSPSPSGLQTRPPGQVQWVSEQWSPPVVASSASPVNPPGLPSKNNEESSQGNRLCSTSPQTPPVPSHSTPTLSLHAKDRAGQNAFNTPATTDLSPSALYSRYASKRLETHSPTVNGDIPLMTSLSDPLPVPLHVSQAVPALRSQSPSLNTAKSPRASPHHISIHPAQQNTPISSSTARPPTMSPVCAIPPVTRVSWSPPVSIGLRSPQIARAVTPSSDEQSATAQSALSPLAPLFVPQHCSASNNLVSI